MQRTLINQEEKPNCPIKKSKQETQEGISQMKTSNDPKVHAKMLKIINHRGNTNENHRQKLMYDH